VGAAAGTLVFPIPILGTILGACLGVGLTVWLVELRRGEQFELSWQRGLGAGLGEFVGIISKFGLGIVVWLIVAVAAFWP
jgi:hypothetical protein